MDESNLLLIDRAVPSRPHDGPVAWWSAAETPPGQHSIPALVDRWAVELRADYLRWVHDVGAHMIGAQSLCDRLRLNSPCSIWWMTLLAEKEPLKSPSIYQIFKLWALERLQTELGFGSLTYDGADATIHETLHRWCDRLGLSYVRVTARRPLMDCRLSKRLVPHTVRAAGHFVNLWRNQARHATRGLDPPALIQAAPVVSVVTWFPNVDLASTRAGRFRSRYWEGLHDVLEEMDLAINWVWVYVESSQASFREAVQLRDACNLKGAGRQRYFLLDEFVDADAVFAIVRRYTAMRSAANQIGEPSEAFVRHGSHLDLSAVVRDDWRRSLFGVNAIDTAYHTVAMERVAARLAPSSVAALTVWEGQPWELALTAAWQRLTDAPIIGWQHSTLPLMDLRSFSDAREYTASPEAKPLATWLAVGGAAAARLLTEGGMPQSRLKRVEALRYSKLPPSPQAKSASADALLVVTGYKPAEARFQLQILCRALRRYDRHPFGSIVVKPHPFCSVNDFVAQLDLADCVIIDDPLERWWPRARLAFVANSTSAAIEALYFGTPVAVCAPIDQLNLSPAFGCAAVPFVADADGLVDFFESPARPPDPGDLLTIDPALPRWRELLASLLDSTGSVRARR